MKLVISDPKSGNSFQAELADEKSSTLHGFRVGQTIDGTVAGLPGYKLKITGGSDREGFPMRPEVPGSRRARLILSSGAGIARLPKGSKKAKSVAGNTIAKSTAQLNVKIEEYGASSLEELGFSAKKKAEAETKAA